LSDRIRRDLRAAVKTAEAPAVQFQRTGAEVPRETVSGGGLDGLQRAFSGFFNTAQASFAQMKESELRTELAAIDRENRDLAVQGRALAEQGAPLTDAPEDFQTRDSFVSSYKQTLGTRLFANNDLGDLTKTLSEWDFANGDPNSYVTDFISEKTKGMDPMVAASYTISARNFSDKEIDKTRRQSMQTGALMQTDTYLQVFSSRMENGEALGVDDLENAYRQLDVMLGPIGQSHTARDKVNDRLFKFIERNPDAEWAQRLINQKDGSGLSLAERYPAALDATRKAQIERDGRPLSLEESRDLDRLAQDFQSLKTGEGGQGQLTEFAARLFDHRMQYGRGTEKFGSDQWRGLYGQYVELVGKDAGYRQFASGLEGRVVGDPRAPRFGADREADWSRWVSEAEARRVPFAAQVTAFVAHNHIPKAIEQRLTADLTSENNSLRAAAFSRARQLEAAFDSNPGMFAKSMGAEGLLVYQTMSDQVKLGTDVNAAAAIARRVSSSGVKPDQVLIGDGKPETVRNAVNRVSDSAVGSINSTFSRYFGDQPKIEASGAMRARFESALRSVTLASSLGYGSTDQSVIEQTAAKLAMADAEFAMIDGAVRIVPKASNDVRVDPTGAAPALRYSPEELGKAAKQFREAASTSFPDLAPLASLVPMQNGQGYEVSVKRPDETFTRRVIVPLGSAYGDIQIPDTIPEFGWQPPQLANTGFMFVPHRDSRGNALLVYRGETAQEAAYRVSLEAENKLVSDLNDQGRTRAAANRSAELQDLGIFEDSENDRYSLRYWAQDSVRSIARGLADRGIINPRTLMTAMPGRMPGTEEGIAKYLEDLMTNASVSARVAPSLGDPSRVYDTQRYQFLSRVEGVRYRAYDDATSRAVTDPNAVKGNRTIGVGFNMERPDAKDIFRSILAIPEKDFADYYNGKKQLSEQHVRTLLNYTADEAERIVENRIGADIVDKLSREQRLVLVSLAFNNPSLVGPNLVAAIKEGRLKDAASEIRNRSNRTKDPGIQSRREVEADKFLNVG
jgi:GH24 family phage-related lysozyme (muramidase)